MGRRCCGWQVDDNSEGFRVVSLFGGAPLERAPGAKHPRFLVVGEGGFGKKATLRVSRPGHPGCTHRRCQEWAVFPEGRISQLAEGKLARRRHGFSNKRPFSIIGLRGEIGV